MTSIFAPLKYVAGRLALRAGLARLGRDETAATAVEFAIVAVPFFALMFAILETALTFFAGQTLETGVATAARMIRTGQAQQQSFDINKFKTEICKQISGLFDCPAGLEIDVRKYTTFDSIDLGVPVDANGNLNVTENYEPGHGGDIVVVRAYYQWPVFVRLLGNDLSDLSNGKHLLISTAAFRNEPFPW
jgi:Flp pilus assembly protein TadG